MSDINCRFTDTPVCPYCGHKNEYPDDLSRRGWFETCGECEREYSVEPEFDVSFCSEKIEDYNDREYGNKISRLNSTISLYKYQAAKEAK